MKSSNVKHPQRKLVALRFHAGVLLRRPDGAFTAGRLPTGKQARGVFWILLVVLRNQKGAAGLQG